MKQGQTKKSSIHVKSLQFWWAEDTSGLQLLVLQNITSSLAFVGIAAWPNVSHSSLQQADPTDIWHWTGMHRELIRFCPSAQLSDRFQVRESCSLSQNLPKVIFLPLNVHVHKHTHFSFLFAIPTFWHTLQKENKSYYCTLNNWNSWKHLPDRKIGKDSIKPNNFTFRKHFSFQNITLIFAKESLWPIHNTNILIVTYNLQMIAWEWYHWWKIFQCQVWVLIPGQDDW